MSDGPSSVVARNQISVQNRGRSPGFIVAMRRMNTKRRIRLRLRAAVLLVCLLLGPLRMVAASFLHGTPDCCSAGMCKTHSHGHAQEKKTAEPSCDHGSAKTVSDCTMKCAESGKESAVPSPALPEIILAPSITISAPDGSQVAVRAARHFFVSRVLTPPDQPPRS
jgi:hypothetical protein